MQDKVEGTLTVDADDGDDAQAVMIPVGALEVMINATRFAGVMAKAVDDNDTLSSAEVRKVMRGYGLASADLVTEGVQHVLVGFDPSDGDGAEDGSDA